MKIFVCLAKTIWCDYSGSKPTSWTEVAAVATSKEDSLKKGKKWMENKKMRKKEYRYYKVYFVIIEKTL